LADEFYFAIILQSYIELYCAVSCFPLINFVSLLFFALVKTGGHLMQ